MTDRGNPQGPSFSVAAASTQAAIAQANAEAYAAAQAATAQSNAEAFAANASNLSSGTVALARLPSLATTNLSDVTASGSWTPTDASGGGLTLTHSSCFYTKIGPLIFLRGSITFPSTSDSHGVHIGSLPFTIDSSAAFSAFPFLCGSTAFPNIRHIYLDPANNTLDMIDQGNLNFVTNAQMSTIAFSFSVVYPTGVP